VDKPDDHTYQASSSAQHATSSPLYLLVEYVPVSVIPFQNPFSK